MLGGRAPVGVDGADVARVGLAAPADQELLGQRRAGVDDPLRYDGPAEAARRLRGVREHHHRDPREVEAGLLVGDVVGLAHAQHRREHRHRGLDVGPDVAGVDRDVVGLGRRQPGLVAAVHEQAPDLLEGHPSGELLDVDAAVAESRALLVGLGDLGRERDHTLEALVDLRCRCGGTALLGHATPRGVTYLPILPGASCTAHLQGRSAHDRVVGSRGERSLRRPAPRVRRRRAHRGPTSRPTRSRCSSGGTTTPSPRTSTSPTRWSSRRCPTTAGRRRGWCCSRGSRPRAGSSSPTSARARAPSCAAGSSARCCSRGTRSSGRCGSTAGPSCCRGPTSTRTSRSRPRRARLGAHASHQSRPVASRRELEDALAAADATYPDEVPVPEEWGGFRVVPEAVEFWQGRPGPPARPARLHAVRSRAGRPSGWLPDRAPRPGL